MSLPCPPPPGKSTWGLHRELQSCLEPIHCISTMYSSSIHVHGMYHFKQMTSVCMYIQWYPSSKNRFVTPFKYSVVDSSKCAPPSAAGPLSNSPLSFPHVTLSEQVLHWGKVKPGPGRGADEVVRRLCRRETRKDPDAWVWAWLTHFVQHIALGHALGSQSWSVSTNCWKWFWHVNLYVFVMPSTSHQSTFHALWSPTVNHGQCG